VYSKMLYSPLMEERRIPVSFRVSPRFKQCLKLAAERDQRSQTNFIEKLVFDYCIQQGLDPGSGEEQPVRAHKKKGQK
jgi:hypothetical protein